LIKIQNTDKYNIKPKLLISDAYETSYDGIVAETPQAPPDTAIFISAITSLVMLSALFFYTYIHELTSNGTQASFWTVLAVACYGIMAFLATKYIKSVKLYKQTAGTPDKRERKKAKFMLLFDSDNLPEEIPAGELLRKVSTLSGNTNNDKITACALRRMSEFLTERNNPGDIMCKLVTTFGDVFTQPKRRLYFKSDNDSLTFYDADFTKPKGEIICDVDDVASFGTFDQYPLRINSSGGGKIKPEALIVEINDGALQLYFEFQNAHYDKIRKLLPGKKELK